MKPDIVVLGIESSCDDTSAAVLRGTRLLSNLIATQKIHQDYGGVVPELASRAHLSNIVPVASEALRQAGLTPREVDAVAFTRGPGLLGALLVGTSFAKGLALATGARLIEVNHLQGHVLSPFLTTDGAARTPDFPFLSLLVSGGHTQIILVRGPLEMEILGNTIDDAAGEAFDKCAKQIGLPYPGGPVVDKLAHEGNPGAFTLARPLPQGLDFSFSGLKTSFLYLVRDHLEQNPKFIEENLTDLCASLQFTIIDILLRKLRRAITETGVKTVTIGGGVAANSGLRAAMEQLASEMALDLFLPERRFTTDNAAMIAIAGYFKHQAGLFATQDIAPMPRMHV
ncbi:MAG: tRNA (adenosine(37)-N6)-threonylcarbamoyltransferase complex transferase subunit TsaD [Bacteroidia bacterium]|nr:MAG: tRNA (adenosine(37)-N6)-threonylcarbamoyltransferase complex transferase subunit TsaD [Bacteroidia bacterium]